MTSAVVQPDFPAAAGSASTARSVGLLAAGGVASLGAGAIHAVAVGVHNEPRQVMLAFTITAIFQIGWGALALARNGRLLALVGAVGNLAAVGGWVLAKTTGISFIDGLEQSEKLQFADTLAAGFAIAAILAATATLLAKSSAASWSGNSRALFGAFGTGVAVVSLFGMTSVGSHGHAGGGGGAAGHHGTEAAATGTADHHGSSAGDDHSSATPGSTHPPAAVVAPKVYDPKLPIDLGGVDGVTPQQQAKAENLIAITLARLPNFADYKAAEAANFHSIGDGFTGYEHFINWDYIADDKVLNPDYPESLVYETEGGKRTLVSAMFMLSPGANLDTVPDIGGKLTQWHIHDNLCFSKDAKAPKVAGITNSQGGCPAGLQKFTPVPMIHVWIRKHECGPFSALEGVGAGQVKPGETQLCDHAHGADS